MEGIPAFIFHPMLSTYFTFICSLLDTITHVYCDALPSCRDSNSVCPNPNSDVCFFWITKMNFGKNICFIFSSSDLDNALALVTRGLDENETRFIHRALRTIGRFRRQLEDSALAKAIQTKLGAGKFVFFLPFFSCASLCNVSLLFCDICRLYLPAAFSLSYLFFQKKHNLHAEPLPPCLCTSALQHLRVFLNISPHFLVLFSLFFPSSSPLPLLFLSSKLHHSPFPRTLPQSLRLGQRFLRTSGGLRRWMQMRLRLPQQCRPRLRWSSSCR